MRAINWERELERSRRLKARLELLAGRPVREFAFWTLGEDCELGWDFKPMHVDLGEAVVTGVAELPDYLIYKVAFKRRKTMWLAFFRLAEQTQGVRQGR